MWVAAGVNVKWDIKYSGGDCGYIDNPTLEESLAVAGA